MTTIFQRSLLTIIIALTIAITACGGDKDNKGGGQQDKAGREAVAQVIQKKIDKCEKELKELERQQNLAFQSYVAALQLAGISVTWKATESAINKKHGAEAAKKAQKEVADAARKFADNEAKLTNKQLTDAREAVKNAQTKFDNAGTTGGAKTKAKKKLDAAKAALAKAQTKADDAAAFAKKIAGQTAKEAAESATKKWGVKRIASFLGSKASLIFTAATAALAATAYQNWQAARQAYLKKAEELKELLSQHPEVKIVNAGEVNKLNAWVNDKKIVGCNAKVIFVNQWWDATREETREEVLVERPLKIDENGQGRESVNVRVPFKAKIQFVVIRLELRCLREPVKVFEIARVPVAKK